MKGRIACKWQTCKPLRKHIDSTEFRTTSNPKHFAQLQYSASQYNDCLGVRSRTSSFQVIELRPIKEQGEQQVNDAGNLGTSISLAAQFTHPTVTQRTDFFSRSYVALSDVILQ